MIATVKCLAVAIAAWTIVLGGNALARTTKIALTFDDLPALSIAPDQAYVDYLNVTLLSGLKRHHFPAIGFVNEGKARRTTA